MGKKIVVNWQKLNNLGNNTAKYAEEFEQIRNNLINITSTINSCWQGIDAENYKITTKAYFESLKEDRNYLEQWSNVFKNSAIKYNGGVEEGLTKVKQTNQTVLDPNSFKNEVMM